MPDTVQRATEGPLRAVLPPAAASCFWGAYHSASLPTCSTLTFTEAPDPVLPPRTLLLPRPSADLAHNSLCCDLTAELH